MYGIQLSTRADWLEAILVGSFRSRFDVPPFCNFAYTSECLKHCLSYGTDAILSADPRPFGFLKEEVQSSIWFGAVLVLFGFSLFFLGEQFINKDSLLGNVLLLTVFGLFTFSQLLTRKIMLTEISTFVVTSSQMVSATVIMFINLIIFGNLELPFQASSGTIMTMVYLVFSLAIPFFLYNQAMRHIPVGMASLFLVLVIPLGFFFAAIFMGEEITLLKITGAVLVMIGVVLPHLLQIGIKRYSI